MLQHNTTNKKNYYYYYYYKNEVGSARLRECDIHPSYQSEHRSSTIPTNRHKEEKGKIVEDYTVVGIEQLRPLKKHLPCSRNPLVPHHRIRGQQDLSRGTLGEEQKSNGAARFCSEAEHKHTDMRPGHRV